MRQTINNESKQIDTQITIKTKFSAHKETVKTTQKPILAIVQ